MSCDHTSDASTSGSPSSPVLSALLKLQAGRDSKEAYLCLVVHYLRNWTNCRCVGIRVLNDEGYLPYESFVGFSLPFWEAENFLCVKSDQCGCIRVLTRQWEPQDLEALSPGQSFFRNDLISWAAGLAPEVLGRFRGKCIEQGFSSVAVIPIVYDDRVIGAIHLADESRGKVPLRVVQFVESIAPLVGAAIIHYNTKAV